MVEEIKRRHTAHLQSRRRSLQPASNVHYRRKTEQRQPASSQTYFFRGVIAAVKSGRLVWYPCAFPPLDSDTPHVWLLLIRHRKEPLPVLSFKIRVAVSPVIWWVSLFWKRHTPNFLYVLGWACLTWQGASRPSCRKDIGCFRNSLIFLCIYRHVDILPVIIICKCIIEFISINTFWALSLYTCLTCDLF